LEAKTLQRRWNKPLDDQRKSSNRQRPSSINRHWLYEGFDRRPLPFLLNVSSGEAMLRRSHPKATLWRSEEHSAKYFCYQLMQKFRDRFLLPMLLMVVVVGVCAALWEIFSALMGLS